MNAVVNVALQPAFPGKISPYEARHLKASADLPASMLRRVVLEIVALIETPDDADTVSDSALGLGQVDVTVHGRWRE